MSNDRALSELDISPAVVSKLEALAIRGLRQLYARLRQEAPGLQQYLQLPDAGFAALRRMIEDVIRREYPDDLTPRTHPSVHKRGVAVHRRAGQSLSTDAPSGKGDSATDDIR